MLLGVLGDKVTVAALLASTELPTFKDLREAGQLTKLTIERGTAFRAKYCHNILVVSHRWETPEQPDPGAVQLGALQDELKQVREVSSRQAEEHQNAIKKMSQEFECASDVTLTQTKLDDEKAAQADAQVCPARVAKSACPHHQRNLPAPTSICL